MNAESLNQMIIYLQNLPIEKNKRNINLGDSGDKENKKWNIKIFKGLFHFINYSAFKLLPFTQVERKLQQEDRKILFGK